MRSRLKLAGAAGFAALIVAASPVRAAEPLTVCLQSRDPPLSSEVSGQAKGFDVALSRAVAERLGRKLAVQWFVTRKDPDSNPPREASALLSNGHCDLLAGYPLIAGNVGHLDAAKGKLPPFAGRTADDRHRWIRLQDLVPTRPYRFDALAVVLSPAHAGLRVGKLSDVSGLKLGVETHGVPDLIAMSYEHGRLADQVVHFPDSAVLFRDLQNDKVDAALVDLHEFDAWRQQHPSTQVTASGYTHSIGFNIGFVGIAADKPLIAEVNGIISDLLSRGTLPAMGKATGLTWLPPRSPAIMPNIPLSAFSGD